MENQKVDYLREDPDIPNQRFVCLSFIEPRDRNVVKQKEVFMASKFIKAFIEEYEVAKEFSQNPNNTITDEIKEKLDLSYENINKVYTGYRKTHFTSLTEEFDKEHNPREAMTVSGVKIRGSYRNLEEAQERAQQMREYEPASDCFVAQVGYWLPYDPENMEDIKAEFREQALNEIYGKKQEALEKAKADFDARKQKMIDENIKENEKKKELNAREAMESMTNAVSHEEKKEDLVILDNDGEEVSEEVKAGLKPVGKPKKKVPTVAKKAGNMRVNQRKR